MKRFFQANAIVLNSKVLHELEDSLNYPLFFGSHVGATLNDELSVAFLNGKRDWSFRTKLSDLFRYFYHRYHHPFKGLASYDHLKGRMLFTLLYDREDLKRLIFPVMENYSPQESFLFADTPVIKKRYANKNVVTWSDFPKINMNEWRNEFNRCEPIWRRRLSEILTANKIPLYTAQFLLASLQVQTQRIMAAKEFFDRALPRIIVTEYDRNSSASCLVIATALKNITSITMIHGAAIVPPPRYGFVPVLADYVCCWGTRHKDNFIEHGVEETRLIVTGCQALKSSVEVDRNLVCSKIGFPEDTNLAMLVTSPIFSSEKLIYAQKFCQAMSMLSICRAIVRLHPAESLSEYAGLISQYPHILFLNNETLSKDEALSLADIVVVHESSFGVDALLSGSIVVVLDALEAQSFTQLMIGKELIEKAGCPSPKTPIQLSAVIQDIFSDAEFRNILNRRALEYGQDYIECCDFESVKKVCTLIDKSVERNLAKKTNVLGRY